MTRPTIEQKEPLIPDTLTDNSPCIRIATILIGPAGTIMKRDQANDVATRVVIACKGKPEDVRRVERYIETLYHTFYPAVRPKV